MICPKCNNQINDGSTICPLCNNGIIQTNNIVDNNNIIPQSNNTVVSSTIESTSVPKKSGGIGIIIGLLVILIIIGTGGFVFINNMNKKNDVAGNNQSTTTTTENKEENNGDRSKDKDGKIVAGQDSGAIPVVYGIDILYVDASKYYVNESSVKSVDNKNESISFSKVAKKDYDLNKLSENRANLAEKATATYNDFEDIHYSKSITENSQTNKTRYEVYGYINNTNADYYTTFSFICNEDWTLGVNKKSLDDVLKQIMEWHNMYTETVDNTDEILTKLYNDIHEFNNKVKPDWYAYYDNGYLHFNENWTLDILGNRLSTHMGVDEMSYRGVTYSARYVPGNENLNKDSFESSSIRIIYNPSALLWTKSRLFKNDPAPDYSDDKCEVYKQLVNSYVVEGNIVTYLIYPKSATKDINKTIPLAISGVNSEQEAAKIFEELSIPQI